MPTRFICPHCHSSIDPQDFDVARSATQQYRICPECDDLIVLSATDDAFAESTACAGRAAEHCLQ